MEKAKVYFTKEITPESLIRIYQALGKELKGKVGVKISTGEPGGHNYLHPELIGDLVHLLDGTIIECCTAYGGQRQDPKLHWKAIEEHGFKAMAPCDIMDEFGEMEIPVEGGFHLDKDIVGEHLDNYDSILVLSHFKGHESVGFGGCLKNIGMGCGSRAGKMEQHNSGKPTVDHEVCRGCHICARNCAHGAISFGEDGKASIDHNKCVGCGRCLGACNFDAIYNENSSANDELNKKIAEYSKAVVDGRPNFHINLVIDISPYCDCHAENDAPIIPDVGMFASFDPVALDQACADAQQDAGHARQPAG